MPARPCPYETLPIRTHGLTHLALAVRDPDRSLRFYDEVFGVKEVYRGASSVQVVGPGPTTSSRREGGEEGGPPLKLVGTPIGR